MKAPRAGDDGSEQFLVHRGKTKAGRDLRSVRVGVVRVLRRLGYARSFHDEALENPSRASWGDLELLPRGFGAIWRVFPVAGRSSDTFTHEDRHD
jgi:hypothetical protein